MNGADEPLTFPPESGISASQRLFSEEVGIATAGEVQDPREPAYEFNNGRRFYAPDRDG
jgi:hypothetical protein